MNKWKWGPKELNESVSLLGFTLTILIIIIIIVGIPMNFLWTRVQESQENNLDFIWGIDNASEVNFWRNESVFVVSWVLGRLLTQLGNLPFMLSHPFFGFWDDPFCTLNSYFLSFKCIPFPPYPPSLFNIDKRVEKIEKNNKKKAVAAHRLV